MKKVFILLFVIVSFINTGFAISCYPNGVTLNTQAEIHDLYIYLGEAECNEIEGNVIIEGNDIQNLDDLSILIKIDGDLIIKDCPNLTSIEGLKNLQSIGGNFEINNIDKIWQLYNFVSLTSIGGDLIIKNNEHLTTLTGGSFGSLSFPGLSNVISINGSIIIESNPFLTQLDGLSGLKTINGHISIKYNDKLANISGLLGITSNVVAIRIVENPLLTSLDGLQNIASTDGDILIENNSLLTNLTGLDGINSIARHLYIWQNSNLTSLHGLENLHSIGKDMQIKNNPELLDLTGLENLETIGQNFEISSNNLLNSLNALDNLVSINGSLWINSNPVLQSLEGINNIVYTTITSLSLRSNYQLSTCDVPSICDYLDAGGDATIIGNNEGCASVSQVQQSCSPPECTTVISPTDNEYDVPLDAAIIWESVDDASGYKISLGTGGNSTQWDLVKDEDVGNTTTYYYNQDFPCKTTIYIKITPYNEHGDQIDCSVSQFTTKGINVESISDENICPGDSIQLHVYTNGTNIVWTPDENINDINSFNPVVYPGQSTEYIATITDEDGCTATVSANVNVYPQISINYIGTLEVCPGECTGKIKIYSDIANIPRVDLYYGDTTMTRTAVKEAIYENLCAGSYQVVVTDSNSCTSYFSFYIDEIQAEISIDSITNVTDTTKGAIDISINNNSRSYGLEWIGMGDLNYQSTKEDIDSLEAGCYQLVVWDSLLNCSVDTTICIEDKSTAVEDLSGYSNLIKIYPNPANDFISILYKNNTNNLINSLKIYNTNGDILIEKNSFNSSIDISSLDVGLYYIKVQFQRGIVFKKIVITR